MFLDSVSYGVFHYEDDNSNAVQAYFKMVHNPLTYKYEESAATADVSPGSRFLAMSYEDLLLNEKIISGEINKALELKPDFKPDAAKASPNQQPKKEKNKKNQNKKQKKKKNKPNQPAGPQAKKNQTTPPKSKKQSNKKN